MNSNQNETLVNNNNQSDQLTNIMINIGLISKYNSNDKNINKLSLKQKLDKIEN